MSVAVRTAVAVGVLACYAVLVTVAALTDWRAAVATLALVVLYELRGVLR